MDSVACVYATLVYEWRRPKVGVKLLPFVLAALIG